MSVYSIILPSHINMIYKAFCATLPTGTLPVWIPAAMFQRCRLDGVADASEVNPS